MVFNLGFAKDSFEISKNKEQIVNHIKMYL